MAVTLPQTRVSFNLGNAVNARLAAFRDARASAQTKAESEFYKAVNENGMTLSDQLAFRKAQLEKEEGRGVTDPDYITSLKKEISDLSKQARFEKIRSIYQSSQKSVASGITNLQTHLDILQGQYNSENDPQMKQELQQQILATQKDLTKSNEDALTNEVTYAQNDKSVDLLNKTITDVGNAKAQALGSGNTEKASALDLKIQALKQTLQVVNVQNQITKLSINKAKKASAVGYLQSLADTVADSDSSTPVVINGTRYDSAQAYWTGQRDQYIATNFFGDLSQEYTNYSKSVGQVNGSIPDSVLKSIQSDFQQFAQRPEMAPYLSRLEVVRTDTLANAIDLTAKAIQNKYTTDQDAQTAISQLEDLQTKYGISTVPYIQSVMKDYGQNQGSFIQGLTSTVSDLVSQGKSYTDAVNTVLSSVKNKEGKLIANNVSSQDLATKSPGDILKGAPESTAKSLTPPAVGTTPGQQPAQTNPQTPGQAAGVTTAPTTPPAPTGLQMPTDTNANPNLPNNPINTSVNQNANPGSYVVAAGDTLSGISKKLLGDPLKYSQIFEANRDILANPNQIKAGQTLKIPKS